LVAIAVRGVSRLGFQTSESPQTAASIAFQPHTAHGKLKAVITPTGPSGRYCSFMMCSARSLGIVMPWS
jgi:hypothetical protein